MALSKEDRDEIIQTINLVAVGLNAKVEAKMDMQLIQVERIQDHLTKEESRLNMMEKKIDTSIQDRLIKDEKVRAELDTIDKRIIAADKPHFTICPNGKATEELEKRVVETEKGLLEISFIKRYGSIILSGIAALLIVSMISFYEIYKKVNNNNFILKSPTVQVDTTNTK